MPDEFLTIDQVAQRLALPPDMIRRRIESGDIPVHWVEAGGKLEMRVAADDIVSPNAPSPGFPAAPAAPTYGMPTGTQEAELRPVAGENAAEEWADTDESEYPQGLWTPVEQPADPEPGLWEASSPTQAADDEPPVPVWRPDPATWDDEPLEETDAEPATSGFQPAPAPYGQPGPDPELTEQYPVAGDEQDPFSVPAPPAADFAAPPAPGFSFDQGSSREAPSAAPEYEAPRFEAAQPAADPYGEETAAFMAADQEQEAPAVEPEPVTPPSALVSSEMAGAGAMAINSIDARELVAGLFERWERALEQRIQAEQRLRFEAELEQRMRQVRDLRQELELTRKAQAAELAEREREMMELRNKLREQEQAPRSRGLFRR